MSETYGTTSLRIDYRHLAFFFLGAVCVCAVFFALGFVVGRAQAFETALKDQEDLKSTANGAIHDPSAPGSARSVTGKKEPSVVTAAPGKAEDAKPGALGVDYRKDLDFYTAVKEPQVDQNFHPESPKPNKTIASAKNPPVESGSGSRAGLVSLQVAALKSSAEADRLAKTLRSKGYPVFIVNPGKEDPSKLIRVQIGPYTNQAEATKAKARLGKEGYTAIIKR